MPAISGLDQRSPDWPPDLFTIFLSGAGPSESRPASTQLRLRVLQWFTCRVSHSCPAEASHHLVHHYHHDAVGALRAAGLVHGNWNTLKP